MSVVVSGKSVEYVVVRELFFQNTTNLAAYDHVYPDYLGITAKQTLSEVDTRQTTSLRPPCHSCTQRRDLSTKR